MKKYNYNNLNEFIYEEKFGNGFRVFYYPKKTTKNFYISITTPYGAKVQKYKKNNKEYEIIPGTAHFLEHRLIDFSISKKSVDELNELGSYYNAYTSYYCTNYNIYGSLDINKNIELLLNKVFNHTFEDKKINKEKGIINEEINMSNDDVWYNIDKKVNNNLYYQSYLNTPILGTIDSIDKITAKYLTRVYRDFYNINNMFMVITGGFDLDSVSNYVNSYFKDFKFPKNKDNNIKVIKCRDKKNVKVSYEEVTLDVEKTRISISYKMSVRLFKGIKKRDLVLYLRLLLNMNFSKTSDVFEEFEENGVYNQAADVRRVENQIIFTFTATTDNTKYYIERVKSIINNLNLSSEAFERKKRLLISHKITTFEDYINVDDLIVNDIIAKNTLQYKSKEWLQELDFNILKNIVKLLDFSNESILIAKK